MKKWVIAQYVVIFLLVGTNPSSIKGFTVSRLPQVIPMRDGKFLAGDLYTTNQNLKKPVILVQTPYDKGFYWKHFSEQIPFSLESYHVVILDWRGRFASKKALTTKPTLGKDGYDAVEWIARQVWSNGKIGTYGGSALGQVQFETAAENPPHLVCAVPMIKDIGQKYETYYFGGEYRKEHTEGLQTLQFLTTDIILSQPRYNNFWKLFEKNQDISPLFQVPMLLISGWFDHYPDLVLQSFTSIKAKSLTPARNSSKLIMGPWQHMTLGQKQQGILEFPNAEGYCDREAIRFMNYYLGDERNGWENTENIQYYQMGEEKWFTAKDWKSIPSEDFSIYLQPGGKMDTHIPSVSKSSSSYLYDPTYPTPSFGGDRFTPGKLTISGPQDQREKVESRKDVLVFTSGFLRNNLPIAGLVQANLYISSDMPDTDFSVRLCDVYPDGKSVLLAEGIQRARFRNSLEKEEFLKKDEITGVNVKLQNLAHTFLKGHQIRLIVSSASYPIYAANPNTADPLYQSKRSNIALNTIYFDSLHPSRIIFQRKK